MRSLFQHLSLIAPLILFVPSAAHPATDARLREMRKKYSSITAITAEFTQTHKNPTLGSEKLSSGRLYIMRPNLFRWETLQPDPSVITTNGIRFWYYTPPFREGEKGQVSIRPAKDVPSQLAVDLLSGRADLAAAFRTKAIAPGHYELKPLKPSGDVKRVELFLESQTNLVYKIRLHTASGNETTIELKKLELGAKLSKSMFSFQAPPGTEVIR